MLTQIMIGLINGSFYAILSLGLAVIFGMLRIINFTHGSQFMMGAFGAYLILAWFGLSYWWALAIVPAAVALTGMAIERIFLRRIYHLDHLYGLILTFGLALMIEGLFRELYGTAPVAYTIPPALRGGWDIGFMFLPRYRGWVIVISLLVCVATWFLIEKTRLGAYLRAATENPLLVESFGIEVPRMLTLTYGFGVALAAFAGVLAAPIYTISPLMGSNIMIVVFAVVVIGGMGSITGAIAGGYALGLVEGVTRYFYPEASSVIIFVVMIFVLLIKPAGLFGRPFTASPMVSSETSPSSTPAPRGDMIALALLFVVLSIMPQFIYSGTLVKFLCFALFACAFNLLLGYAGLLSFGHAAFFGSAGYAAAHAVKVWGWNPEFGIALGVAIACVLGYAFGRVATRLSGLSFGMITLALNQVVYFVCLKAPFTGGEDGIQGIPRSAFFGVWDVSDSLSMYYAMLLIAAIGFVVVYRTIYSPFGVVLRGLRENENRMISLGYEPTRYTVRAMVISAGVAGLAGGMMSLAFQIATLYEVSFIMSGNAVMMTLLGGVGTFFGPIVGAALFVGMEQYLAGFGSLVTVLQGAIFVICVLAFRRGGVGEVVAFFTKFRFTTTDRRPAESAPT